MNALSDHNTNASYVERTITKVLGYCCLWAFFSLFRRTEMIALRLGVTSRTVRLYKERHRDGEFKCEGCAKCLKDFVKAQDKLR